MGQSSTTVSIFLLGWGADLRKTLQAVKIKFQIVLHIISFPEISLNAKIFFKIISKYILPFNLALIQSPLILTHGLKKVYFSALKYKNLVFKFVF